MSTYCQPTREELDAVDLAALRAELKRTGFKITRRNGDFHRYRHKDAWAWWNPDAELMRRCGYAAQALCAIAAVTDECPRAIARRLRSNP